MFTAYSFSREYLFAMISHAVKEDRKHGNIVKSVELYVSNAMHLLRHGNAPISRHCSCGQDAYIAWACPVPHISQIQANVEQSLSMRLQGFSPFCDKYEEWIRQCMKEVLLNDCGHYGMKLIAECELYCSSLLA